MSEQSPRGVRSQVVIAPPNTPEELEAATARSRAYKKTAAGQVGCEMVIDAPLPLLAQFIAELAPEDRQEFLKELIERLPADVLPGLGEALQQRLGRGAA
jgi:hypothetical protein